MAVSSYLKFIAFALGFVAALSSTVPCQVEVFQKCVSHLANMQSATAEDVAKMCKEGTFNAAKACFEGIRDSECTMGGLQEKIYNESTLAIDQSLAGCGAAPGSGDAKPSSCPMFEVAICMEGYNKTWEAVGEATSENATDDRVSDACSLLSDMSECFEGLLESCQEKAEGMVTMAKGDSDNLKCCDKQAIKSCPTVATMPTNATATEEACMKVVKSKDCLEKVLNSCEEHKVKAAKQSSMDEMDEALKACKSKGYTIASGTGSGSIVQPTLILLSSAALLVALVSKLF